MSEEGSSSAAEDENQGLLTNEPKSSETKPAADNSQVLNFLTECQNLYGILTEEDPAYRMVEDLQNAGVIPVNPETMQRNRSNSFGASPASSMQMPTAQSIEN